MNNTLLQLDESTVLKRLNADDTATRFSQGSIACGLANSARRWPNSPPRFRRNPGM